MRLRNVKNKEEIMKQSSYLVEDSFPFKGKWKSCFKNNHPIYVEIGMGKGKFIIENAIQNPDINYIGIEKYDSVIARALEKIPEGLENLKMIRMNALEIDNVFSHEVDKIYLNFSDPWPKKRHHDRRLTSKIFLKKYDSVFKEDCDIEMRTDNEELFIYSIESFSQYGYSLYQVSFNLHRDYPPLITTEYEDKFVKQGNSIFYLTAKKNNRK